jgi:hypothetical protein
LDLDPAVRIAAGALALICLAIIILRRKARKKVEKEQD